MEQKPGSGTGTLEPRGPFICRRSWQGACWLQAQADPCSFCNSIPHGRYKQHSQQQGGPSHPAMCSEPYLCSTPAAFQMAAIADPVPAIAGMQSATVGGGWEPGLKFLPLHPRHKARRPLLGNHRCNPGKQAKKQERNEWKPWSGHRARGQPPSSSSSHPASDGHTSSHYPTLRGRAKHMCASRLWHTQLHGSAININIKHAALGTSATSHTPTANQQPANQRPAG